MIAALLQAGLGFVISVVQCGLIYVGLRRMGQASDERRTQHEETMDMHNAHLGTWDSTPLTRPTGLPPYPNISLSPPPHRQFSTKDRDTRENYPKSPNPIVQRVQEASQHPIIDVQRV